jgi:RNA polymerase sigma-70 factor (ECF subfamily)
MESLDITTWNQINVELRNFVFKKVKDRDVANDIVQDVFIKVQSKIGQLRETEKITGWIYQITRHAITDYFRAKAKSLSTVELQWEDDAQELNDCVATCLNKLVYTLPEKYREAVVLTEVENLSQIQLAERLGISYSGAKSRVQRGRQLLKEKLHKLYTIETDAYGNIIVCEDKVPCGCNASYQEQVVMPESTTTC